MDNADREHVDTLARLHASGLLQHPERQILLEARAGHVLAVSWLLRYCSDDVLEAVDVGTGETALHCACAAGRLECVRALVAGYRAKHGGVEFKLDMLPPTAATVLHSACHSDRSVILSYLITELGLDPNTAATDGTTPLHVAACRGALECTRLLLADQRTRLQAHAGNQRFEPLHCAVVFSQPRVLQLLLQTDELHSLRTTRLAALAALALVQFLYGRVRGGRSRECTEEVAIALVRRAMADGTTNPNQPVNELAAKDSVARNFLKSTRCSAAQLERSLLHCAVQAGMRTLVRELLDSGADPLLRDRASNQSALEEAEHRAKKKGARDDGNDDDDDDGDDDQVDVDGLVELLRDHAELLQRTSSEVALAVAEDCGHAPAPEPPPSPSPLTSSSTFQSIASSTSGSRSATSTTTTTTTTTDQTPANDGPQGIAPRSDQREDRMSVAVEERRSFTLDQTEDTRTGTQGLHALFVDLFPLAAPLALQVHHALGVDVHELSGAQLEGLAQFHQTQHKSLMEVMRHRQDERDQEALEQAVFIEQLMFSMSVDLS